MDEVKCPLCGGPMNKKTISSGNFGGIILALIVFFIGFALIFVLPIIGVIVGPLVMLAALFMGGKRRSVWKCSNCGHVLDRAAKPSPIIIGAVFLIVIGAVLTFFTHPLQQSQKQEQPIKSQSKVPQSQEARSDPVLGFLDPSNLQTGKTYELFSESIIAKRPGEWTESVTVPSHYLFTVLNTEKGKIDVWYFVEVFKQDGSKWKTGWMPSGRIYDVKKRD